MKKPKLTISNNHLSFRERLIFLLNIENSAEIIGKASTGEELIALLDNHHPDLILMDIFIPQHNGIEVVRKSLMLLPDLKMVAITMFGDDEYIISLIKEGVNDFMLKSNTILEIEKDIHSYLTVENYCMNNQVINIINKSSVNKLQMPNVNKRISGKAKNLYDKFNLEILHFEQVSISKVY